MKIRKAAERPEEEAPKPDLAYEIFTIIRAP
jgi:hypothetical protein